jgi:hypothetical protein
MWELSFVDDKRHGCHKKYFDIDGKMKQRVECEHYFEHGNEVGTYKMWYFLSDAKTRQLRWTAYYQANGTFLYKEYNPLQSGKLLCCFSSDSDHAPQCHIKNLFVYMTLTKSEPTITNLLVIIIYSSLHVTMKNIQHIVVYDIVNVFSLNNGV